VAPVLPVVEGDASLLAGAVGRLLDNAIKFSKTEGGHATVRARRTDGFVTLEVEDDGAGIAPEEQTRLSELFYQVDREQNEQQGAGCGLTIAHAVAAIHGGRLEVTSQIGVGSTFAIHIPCSRAPS
jgi:signal transduction histidine kinase